MGKAKVIEHVIRDGIHDVPAVDVQSRKHDTHPDLGTVSTRTVNHPRRHTDHDLPVNLAPHRPLLPPGPAEAWVEGVKVLPLRMDITLLVHLKMLRIPDTRLRGNLLIVSSPEIFVSELGVVDSYRVGVVLVSLRPLSDSQKAEDGVAQRRLHALVLLSREGRREG